MTNVLVGEDEVGSGCVYSAAGQHFRKSTAHGAAAVVGEPIAGFEPERIRLAKVEVRRPSGLARPAEAGHQNRDHQQQDVQQREDAAHQPCDRHAAAFHVRRSRLGDPDRPEDNRRDPQDAGDEASQDDRENAHDQGGDGYAAYSGHLRAALVSQHLRRVRRRVLRRRSVWLRHCGEAYQRRGDEGIVSGGDRCRAGWTRGALSAILQPDLAARMPMRRAFHSTADLCWP